jgi:hypothetical protein
MPSNVANGLDLDATGAVQAAERFVAWASRTIDAARL